MRTSSEKLSSSQSLFSAQNLIIAGISWAVLSLLFFLLFSITPPGEDQPLWYSYGTLFLEVFAFLAGGILCLRNWRSPQIVSGRTVWLAIGSGLLLYGVGDIFFGCWELIWQLEPDVSLGDICFLLSYICLGWGMVLAVLSKRVNLEIWQWAVLAAIAAIGVALAFWLSLPTEAASGVAEEVVSATEVTSTAPAFILSLDEFLSKYSFYVGLFYVIADVLLLIIATALLLAFWGGRFSQSWQMIAAATFSLYIADMWFKYADSRIENYQSGNLLEVFWIFSPVLFGIGAVLEYHISTRSRQGRRRRGSSSSS
jgi:hypothetical protein